jgi:pimeloyl-ACP methyl ester carboxylesterase
MKKLLLAGRSNSSRRRKEAEVSLESSKYSASLRRRLLDRCKSFNGLHVLAAGLSGVAILLALDLGRFRFTQVDVGGHELRMFISGRGSPAVVFEAGGSGAAGGPLEAWERVQPAVSRLTTTVAYDRAGIGRSAPGPKPRDARQIARELHTALHSARVAPPYVLVGHSLGGPFIRVFADLYPEEVGGLVLVDPTQEEFITWNQARDPKKDDRQDEEWKDILASLAEAHASRVPPNTSVILITAMGPRVLPSFMTEKQRAEFRTLKPMWMKFHREWLQTVPNGQHIITENSGHVVPFEEPDLIVRAVRQIVEQARSRQ